MGYGNSPLEVMACDAMLKGLVFLDEFTYSAAFVLATPTELAASGTTEISIQIDSGADFLAQALNITAFDDSGAYIPEPNYLLTLVRGGSGRELMNQAQHVLNICGNYRHQRGEKPCPGLCASMSQLTVRLQNLTSDAPARVDIALLGFKVFYLAVAGVQADRRKVFHAM
jgi:hypothetical protein